MGVSIIALKKYIIFTHKLHQSAHLLVKNYAQKMSRCAQKILESMPVITNHVLVSGKYNPPSTKEDVEHYATAVVLVSPVLRPVQDQDQTGKRPEKTRPAVLSVLKSG